MGKLRQFLLPAVIMNSEPLVMTKGGTKLKLIPFVQGGELLVLWQLMSVTVTHHLSHRAALRL